jgi:hypothetical protein
MARNFSRKVISRLSSSESFSSEFLASVVNEAFLVGTFWSA